MTNEQLDKFKKIIGKRATINIREKTFIKVLTDLIQIEHLKDNPQRWQDIWVYNYIIYDMPKNKKLLTKYAKEVIEPSEAAFLKLIKEVGFN